MNREKLTEATIKALTGKLTETTTPDDNLITNIESVFSSDDWEFSEEDDKITVEYVNDEYLRVTSLSDEYAEEDTAYFDKNQTYTIADIKKVKSNIIKSIREFIKYYNQSHKEYAKSTGDYDNYDQSNWNARKETGRGKPVEEVDSKYKCVIDALEAFKKKGVDLTDFVEKYGIGKGARDTFTDEQFALYYMCDNIERYVSDKVFQIICDPYLYISDYYRVSCYSDIGEWVDKNNDSIEDLKLLKKLAADQGARTLRSYAYILQNGGVDKLKDLLPYVKFIADHNYNRQEADYYLSTQFPEIYSSTLSDYEKDKDFTDLVSKVKRDLKS